MFVLLYGLLTVHLCIIDILKVRPKRVNQNISGVTENARAVKSDTNKDGINVFLVYEIIFFVA